MLFINKQTTAALFLGGFFLMISGCESNVPTQSVDESETLQESVESQNQKSKSSDGRLLKDVLEDLEPGIISKSYFTGKMRKFLEEKGIDPEQVRSSDDIPDNIKLFWNNEVRKEFIEDRKVEGKGYGKASVLSDPEYSNQFQFMGGNPVPAKTEFEVVDTQNPPASGSITVTYEGEQVTNNYSQYQSASTVAYALASDINNDPDIEVTATVPTSGTVLLTEKSGGCEYNGNPVYVSHTNGTHISVNNDTFYMADGHDGEGWCPPPPPDPITVIVDYDSYVNKDEYTGLLEMGSYTWASAVLYYISIATRSYQDGILITDQFYELYDASQIDAGLTTVKDPEDPSIFWQQFGEHVWWFHPEDEILLYSISYDWTNF